jgi:hypothetical protein
MRQQTISYGYGDRICRKTDPAIAAAPAGN